MPETAQPDEPDAQVEPVALRSAPTSLANLRPEMAHLLTPLSAGTEPLSLAEILTQFDDERAKYSPDGDLAFKAAMWQTIYAELDDEAQQRGEQAAA